ncbi:MAG: right-handed parallel beta-helix repeat-containing protein [Methanobrevibacter sp.]|uniref:right-handed parallel beta-helix repeat-containing protein n=1 Tax=Methanobrevibacter sp. TaxID=66852 RepID=UPI0025F0CD44|nr:right-handed parallel beta-helix repeat-containing protein [Methanobrevibacter sp.]MBQ8018390.1 right-handed parallel beta-helix repeat-containing protein [Methanobrevibacter sp.]
MNTDKKIFICALLALMILLCINGVSAQDTIDKNLTESDTGEGVIGDDSSLEALEVSDSGEKLGAERTVNNYNELVTACTEAADGDTIILNDGTYEFPESSGSIYLTSSTGSGNYAKSLTFKGQTKNGVTIISHGDYAIFQATDNYNLKLQNLNFKDITVSGSSVVFTSSSANLNIVDCNFENCKLGWGTIRSSSAGANTISGVNILNCEQTANKAAATALTFTRASTVNVEKVLIDSPKYSLTGATAKGVIYLSNNNVKATFDDLTIKNSAGIKTSLIYCAGKVSIRNSNILDNTVESTKIIHNAGTLTIEQTIFSNNVATGSNSVLISDVGSTSVKSNLTLNYNNIADNTVDKIYSYNDVTKVVTATANYNYWGANYDNTDAVKTATNIDQTTWVNKNGDTFVDQSGNALAESIPTPSATPAAGDIYVSSTGDDAKDGSTPDNAVQSIKHAIELAENGGNIIVIAGDYTIAETLSISKDLTIKCESGLATIKGTASQMFDNSASLSLENIKFTNDNGIIINNNAGTLTVEKCTFEVDGADVSAISVDGGNVNIQNSVLLNPTGYALTVSSTPATITANNNWWGKNDAANTNASVDSWIVMDASIDLERINPGDEVTITVSFEKTNSGSAYEGTLPEFNVTVSANNLNEIATIKNNKATVKYTVNSDDEATITSESESVKLPLKLYEAPDVIYVDWENGINTNDGDEAHPVKTIDRAIELAQKGKIVILAGTYTIDNTLEITKDLDITGEGTVIIDGNNKRFLTNRANLNITNVQFTNGFDNGGVIYNYGNLTLNRISVYLNIINSRANAAIINNNKKIVIDNSKFYQNNASYGNVYNNGGEVLINNTEFYNNGLTDDTNTLYGIGLYSRYGNAVVENTKFYQNEGMFSVINFVGKSSLDSSAVNTLTVTNCTFENNQLVRYGVIYSEKSNTNIKDSTFTNNVVKKSSTANGEGSAIYVNGEKVNVETSVFMNNNADDLGKDIYVSSGELTISDSVLLNTNGYSIEKESSASVTAENNWWGANTPNTPVTVNKWIVMTVSSNDTNIEVGDEITLTASFDKTNDGESYTGDLPEVFDVTFTSTSGNLNEVKTVKDKKAEVTYTVDEKDKYLTASSNDATHSLKVNKTLDIIYVGGENADDNNDGDVDTPVATIDQAIKLAKNGQIIIREGNYKTGDLGIISDDLNITGEGKVIIDAENSNRILYVGQEANVVLKNLIMINGFGADESGALLGNSNKLTIINCTLANSSAGENNGGAIYNVASLTIINSTIANNTAKVGGAIYSGSGLAKSPTITIENSIIENNIASGNEANGGGAIFAQQITGIDVKNTTFENNQAQTTASGGAIFVSLSDANINIENSRFIKNHANSKEDYGGGAIYMAGTSNYERKGSLTISNTLFEENTADTNGGAVYVRATNLKISSSVLINNSDENGYAIYGYGTEQINPSVNVNTNWWGTNEGPESAVGGYRFTPSVSTWAVLTVSNSSEIKVGETVTLTATINTLNDGSTLANPINIETPITITTNLGPINGVLTNGEFTYDYTVPEGLKFISASVDDEDEVLFVITTSTTVAIENITANKGDRVEYTIKVTSSDGTIINKGNVELYFDDDLVKIIDVINGEAKDTITIAKDIGESVITAIYIDGSEEYGESSGTAALNVTGNNDIVTPETFSNFFDENGVLRYDVPFDELIFKGEFKNLRIVLDDSISIKGDGAIFNNTSVAITAYDVKVKGIKFIADEEFIGNDNSLIYIGAGNAVVEDNEIIYNAPDNVESYVIRIDVASDVKITGNNITYTAKSNGDVKTMAINADEADNLIFEDNKLNANISSVPNGFVQDNMIYYSVGVFIKDSDEVSVNKNDITVNYNGFVGSFDSIYGVYVDGCDDSKVTDNEINVNGHEYAYGLITNDCDNIIISGNTINAISEGNYADGVQVAGSSTGNVVNNNILAKAVNVTYPVYFDDWGNDKEVNLTNNKIKGESDTVYGVYVEENKTTISNNDIKVDGNHVYGIITHQTDAIIDGNNITVNGKDIGSIVSQQSGVNVNSTGIVASEGSALITNNNIVSTSNSTIDAINTNATIKDNGLTANGTTGENTISNINSNVASSGNTEAYKKPAETTPTQPVVKITATNNAKVYYGNGYTIRVTLDGKSVGAGKQVTLKIAGKTLKATTNANGYATFNLAVKPKAYTATVTYNGISQKYKVTVKNVIKAKNIKVKKSAKKLKIKVTLKAGKKAIKGKKVILKIKGKKIKAKTNKKGVATFKIKKSILKKLKAGKKYKYTVTYGKDTVKKTLKVKK